MDRKLIAAAALALLSTAGGGVVPDGMGAWDNGARDPIPSSSTIHRWRYDTTFDQVWRDRIMWAVASIDYEMPKFRLLYAISASDPYQIHFDIDSAAADPACSVDDERVCVLATTTCGTWGEYAGASYRVCSQFRVRVIVNNIVAAAAYHGKDLAEYAHGTLRHEVGHALGLNHGQGGPMSGNGLAPLSACQRAMLESFTADTALTTWAYAPAPQECQ